MSEEAVYWDQTKRGFTVSVADGDDGDKVILIDPEDGGRIQVRLVGEGVIVELYDEEGDNLSFASNWATWKELAYDGK